MRAFIRTFCLLLASLSATVYAASIKLPQLTGGKTGFTRLSAATTGIQFTNYVAEIRSITNRNLLSGSGLAAGDVDGDGLCDLYFCALDGSNVLYRNLGNWKFSDITQ